MTRTVRWISIVVVIASCEKRDPLYCGMNMNDPRCLDDGGATGDVPPGYVTISGTVTGLQGAGLVLQNSGGDDKLIASSGSFGFATPIPMDTAYEVTVGTQPTNPSQMCMVTNGVGTAATNVSDVQVDCTTAAYTVGGTVVGCTGGCPGTLTLTDNGGDDKLIAGNGMFTFATAVPSQSAYAVAVKGATGPTCMVSGGMGVVGNANISTVVVNCTPGTYILSGTSPTGGVTGLIGSVGLHAAYSGTGAPPADTIAVSTNSFAFPSPLQSGVMWDVTVSTPPAYPPAAQDCALTQSGTGTMPASNVTSVTVACTTKQFAIGGMVSGLNAGGSVVLRNNGGDNLTVSANGNFTFATKIYSGFTYATTVLTPPLGQACAVTMGSGTAQNADVTSVRVSCSDPGIKCNTSFCTPSSDRCCDPTHFHFCEHTNQQCFALSLPCDDAASCGSGQKCCAQTHNGNGNVDSVSCQSSCGGTNPVQMCNPGVSGECSSGKTCQAWNKLPGYYACL